jgi:hypothetical protein
MKTMTRQAAIADLRSALVAAAGEHSICQVAKEKNLFCRGFDQWKLHELKQRYPQITRSRSRLSRPEMEELADRWQLARQFVRGESLACDVQMQEGQLRTCAAWEGFDDDELERFHLELCGEEIRIEEQLEESTRAAE